MFHLIYDMASLAMERTQVEPEHEHCYRFFFFLVRWEKRQITKQNANGDVKVAKKN